MPFCGLLLFLTRRKVGRSPQTALGCSLEHMAPVNATSHQPHFFFMTSFVVQTPSKPILLPSRMQRTRSCRALPLIIYVVRLSSLSIMLFPLSQRFSTLAA